MAKCFFEGRMEKVVEFLLVLFGIFLLSQTLRSILEGSWSTEELFAAINLE